MSTMYLKYSTWPPWYEDRAMASASSCNAARTTSSTERLCPRWITSAPWLWMIRRMMLMAASWPSNRLAAVTNRSGVASASVLLAGMCLGCELMEKLRGKIDDGGEPVDSTAEAVAGFGALQRKAMVRRRKPGRPPSLPDRPRCGDDPAGASSSGPHPARAGHTFHPLPPARRDRTRHARSGPAGYVSARGGGC